MLPCTASLAVEPPAEKELNRPVTASEHLRYPRSFSGYEERDSYALALLQLALDKAGSPLTLTPSTASMGQDRALTELGLQRNVEVVWAMTSTEREEKFLPIRISIDKGLMGWRLALVAKERPLLLQNVHSLSDLQAFQAGQGHDWPDRNILAENGLPVQVSASYEGLFHMLAAGRFDYFPRSLLEVWDEAKSYQQLGLSVDPYLVLHYPTTSYFFVAKNNPQLAETLRTGLERALADGSFDALFFKHNGAFLRQLKLSQRRVLELSNPLLPAATPLSRPELWLNREQLRQLEQTPAKP
ncbi:MAG: transporter substrate-binding domain-containing protein [Pseudomonadaceae bacterium]|jgi:hypothetical protein|nr:transporter substrate-binding domain-containing protein [Pseudomonadaceae bacterium]